MPEALVLHDRREFCKQVATAAACTGGFALLSACGGNPAGATQGSPLAQISGSVANGGVSVPVAAGGPLANAGAMAMVTSTAGNFLVARTSASQFVAVTANCTHDACVVSNATLSSYVCPCHGSEFDTSGRVIVGPAVTPLRQFQTQFSNNVLIIS